MKHQAVNWNKQTDAFSKLFWDQNTMQFWLDTEIPVSSDKASWATLSKEEQEVFKKVLGGLTLLDTKQGGEGMPLILLHTKNLQAKAVLAFMGGMEEVHAKSYSTIFTTLATTKEIDDVFEWVDNHPQLQYKADIISTYYQRIFTPNPSKKDVYMALVASVFLESFLFYSGFFYPLYLSGQGKMMASGDMINLILRDESIHGVFVGLLAQEIHSSFTDAESEELEKEVEILLTNLYQNEVVYSSDVYSPIGLEEDVHTFLRYNANKAMMNLGLEPYFEDEDINPIVENGLSTDTKNHDFFSVKGNGYVKAVNIEEMTDTDFVF